jgi:two-component system sensor histidine kinase SenX3
MELLVAALRALDDGVIVVDANGSELFRSGGAERFRDARHADAVAEHAIQELLGRALEGETCERELALFGPPREALLIRAAPLRVDGGSGAAAFIRDVTEFRHVEHVRRDFVANVSHELKTPIGALELLAETLATCDDVDVTRRLADQLVREADRLGRIVDDLLDLSLIEAQETPTRERTPVRIVVDAAVERVRALALARSIPLRVGAIDDSLMILCDQRQVLGAVTNLLDNAVKYSEPGQPVGITARQHDDRVAVAVVDQGIGIPSRDLERVFERFYRVDKARSRSTGGTGLGLSIVRHVAQVHGGEVTVESIEGEGSTFRLWLPLADAAGFTRPMPAAEAS